MKTLTLLFFIIFFLISDAFNQCIPENYSNPGIYPSKEQNLDTAFTGIPYEEVMTAVIPKDTLFLGNRIPFDSVGVIEFSGLPNGFTYQINSASGFWPGNSKGCLIITGTAQESQIGKYPLEIKILAVVGGLLNQYTIKDYSIIISGNSTIYEFKTTDNLKLKTFFDPIKKSIIVNGVSKINQYATVYLYDLNGKVSLSYSMDFFAGHNHHEINVNQLKYGLYFLQIISENHCFSSKFVITD